MRLVGPDGAQIGVVSTQDALRRAQDLDLDLVEVAPLANPPVARIMDYGKFKYERDIKAKEARKRQARIEVKEIKFRPKIDTHDYDTKKGHVERFLRAGSRVKITIMFRGREMSHTELGRKILDRLVVDLAEIAVVDAAPKQDGRNMIMVLAPTKKQAAKVAAEVDPNVHSCGSVRATGAADLAHPEPGFYIVGAKSYGRAPTFLALTGYEQVRSDPVLLQRVLQNLMSNAIRYTARGKVSVTCRANDALAEITVRDTGPGMTAEMQRDIFAEFYRGGQAGEQRRGLQRRIAGLLGVEREPLGDVLEADAVGVVHRAAAIDRPAVAVDPHHIDVACPLRLALFQDQRAFVDHRV